MNPERGWRYLTKNEALLLFALDPFYTEDELKEKWRFLVKHHHPDHGHNPEHFKRLVIAHQVLKEHRKKISAKQEWFDYISWENQREKNHHEAQKSQEYINLLPVAGTVVPLVALTIVGSYYMTDYLRYLYDFQLKMSAASGKLMHAFTPW